MKRARCGCGGTVESICLGGRKAEISLCCAPLLIPAGRCRIHHGRTPEQETPCTFTVPPTQPLVPYPPVPHPPPRLEPPHPSLPYPLSPLFPLHLPLKDTPSSLPSFTHPAMMHHRPRTPPQNTPFKTHPPQTTHPNPKRTPSSTTTRKFSQQEGSKP